MAPSRGAGGRTQAPILQIQWFTVFKKIRISVCLSWKDRIQVFLSDTYVLLDPRLWLFLGLCTHNCHVVPALSGLICYIQGKSAESSWDSVRVIRLLLGHCTNNPTILGTVYEESDYCWESVRIIVILCQLSLVRFVTFRENLLNQVWESVCIWQRRNCFEKKNSVFKQNSLGVPPPHGEILYCVLQILYKDEAKIAVGKFKQISKPTKFTSRQTYYKLLLLFPLI